MKKLIIMFLVIGAAISFWSCSENNPSAPEITQIDQISSTLAKKPGPNLIGEMNLTFTLANFPQVWDGTVDFGEGVVVGIRFQSLSMIEHGQTSHFEENFQIYNLDNPEYVYMGGSDAGSLSMANLHGGCLHGVVEEVNAPYEDWLGRRFHVKATLIMGPDGPAACEGVVRLN